MSDANDNLDDESPASESSVPMAGERLAEARREQQIPVIEIAKELHLDEYKVRALERNDFEVIGAPVFAKGHLRKYAQLVKVDESEVMADYYHLDRSAAAPPVFAARSRPREMVSLTPWVSAIAVILVVATSYWWFAVRETVAERPVTGEVTPLPQAIDDAVENDDGAEDELTTVVDEPIEALQAAPEPEPAVLSTSPPVASETSLSISFSGDCWTEISDASGRRLFFGLGKTGRVVELSGDAPFNVLFGDAGNVSIAVNGVAHEIPAADRRGRTARLTIAGT